MLLLDKKTGPKVWKKLIVNQMAIGNLFMELNEDDWDRANELENLNQMMQERKMLKSNKLMRLEEVGVFYQDRKTGEYLNGLKDDVDLTPYLLKAGMFEH